MRKKYPLLILLTFAFQCYFAQCDSGLVLNIPFDRGGIDLSIYQHHATVSSALSQNRATDRFNDTATFRWTSLNSTLTIDQYDSAAIKSGLPLTFSSWIYLDSLNQSQALFANEEHPSRYSGIFLSVTPNNQLAASLGFGVLGPQGRRSAITVRSLDSSQWYFITVTFKVGNLIDIYIDGKKEAVTTSGSGSGIGYYGSQYSPSIGKFRTQYLRGKIDNIKMWNRALDTMAIKNLYLEEKYEKNLVLHRTFSGNTEDISPFQQASLSLNAQGSVVDTTNQLGMPQSAYYFNDSSQFTGPTTSISAPLNVDFPFSLTIWLNTADSALAFNSIYTNNDRNNRYTGFWVQLVNGQPAISVGDGGAPGPSSRRSTTSDSTLSADKWYQIAFVVKSVDSMDIYIDTVKTSTSQTGTGNIISYFSSGGFESIGGFNKGTTVIRYFKGLMGDIKLWNDSISEDYIKYLFQTNQERIDLIPGDTLLACLNDSLKLSAASIDSEYSLKWSTGSLTSTEAIQLDTDGRKVICLTATDNQGNTINDRIVIDVLSPADTTVTLTNDTLISNDSTVSYQWLDCDNNFAPINGATQRSFTPTVQGSYAVELTTKNLCKDTSACVLVNLTSLNEALLNRKNIMIYPNPANDVLFIKSDNLGKLSLRIYTQTGQILLNQDYTNQNGISTAFLKNGIYWIELSQGNDRLRKKFVIAR